MEQSPELVAVKRKIRALSQMSINRGATEAEAYAALLKVGDLLDQYNLSMDEVMLRDEPCVHEQYDLGSKKRTIVWECAMNIATMCEVKMWFRRPTRGCKGNIEAHWFGLEADVSMAMFLCDIIEDAYRAALAAYKTSDDYINYHGHRTPLVTNFLGGFETRINFKLCEIARARENERSVREEAILREMEDRMIEGSDKAQAAYANQKTGTKVLSLAKEKLIAEEFKTQLGIRLTSDSSFRGNGQFNANAVTAGNRAANNVNLGRPIAEKKGTFGGLLS